MNDADSTRLTSHSGSAGVAATGFPGGKSQLAGDRAGDDNGPQKCFICSKDLAASGWFCRIPSADNRIVLCSPHCALGYFDLLHPTTIVKESDRADYEGRVHFLVNGE